MLGWDRSALGKRCREGLGVKLANSRRKRSSAAGLAEFRTAWQAFVGGCGPNKCNYRGFK